MPSKLQDYIYQNAKTLKLSEALSPRAGQSTVCTEQKRAHSQQTMSAHNPLQPGPARAAHSSRAAGSARGVSPCAAHRSGLCVTRRRAPSHPPLPEGPGAGPPLHGSSAGSRRCERSRACPGVTEDQEVACSGLRAPLAPQVLSTAALSRGPSLLAPVTPAWTLPRPLLAPCSCFPFLGVSSVSLEDARLFLSPLLSLCRDSCVCTRYIKSQPIGFTNASFYVADIIYACGNAFHFSHVFLIIAARIESSFQTVGMALRDMRGVKFGDRGGRR
ncbi:hypothetical protein NDU88_010246 [Pleurodeles waltl]|uniref:Uncharacterized protein n=1 Tax=Pleurodeles waltl TaxID=8319 RepID=A0AAV7PUD2_PLEWA|nr:hypothetical protein NDU88_010246 [Pleurodeles waltl]